MKRKRRTYYPTSALTEAIREAESGKLSIRQAAIKYGVPRTTVFDKVRGRTPVNARKGPPPFLSEQEEQRLALWTVQMALDGQPCSGEQIQEMAQKIVQEDGRVTPFKDGKPGSRWLKCFLFRNPDVCPVLGLESAAPTPEEVDKWFAGLHTYLEQQSLLDVLDIPNCIWSVSELIMTLSQKGGRVTSLTRTSPRSDVSDRITILTAMNASGIVCPPMLCFPVTKRQKTWEPSCGPPASWKSVVSSTGALNPNLFLGWLQEHFQPFLLASETRTPILLFVDGQSTYITEEAGQFCTENGIVLYRFPPNSGRLMDPVELSIFKSLKEQFNKEIASWQDDNPDQNLTKENISPFFASVWKHVEESPQVARDGFRYAGLYPLDRRYNRLKVLSSVDQGGPSLTCEDSVNNTSATPKQGPSKGKQPKKCYVTYSKQDLFEAIRRVELGELSMRQAACEYTIPRSTLLDKLSGRTPLNARMGALTYLSEEEEEQLASWAIKMVMGGRNFTTSQLTEMAQKIVLADGRLTPFKDGKPGSAWYRSFLVRHPELAKARGTVQTGTSPEDIDDWFANLRSYLQDENALSILEIPDRIWSASEFIFPLSQREGEITFIEKKRCSSKVRKRGLTVFQAIAASGAFCPPMVCYPGRKPPTTWTPLDGAPDSWICGFSHDGLLNSELLLKWLKEHFYLYLKTLGTHFPVLLLLEGHSSFVSDEAADFCAENGIILNRFPAFSSCVLDPVELAIIDPLRAEFKQEVRSWKEGHPEESLTKEAFTQVYYPAFAAIESRPDLPQSGFWASGLFPFDGNYNREKLISSLASSKGKVTTSKADGNTIARETAVMGARKLTPVTSPPSSRENMTTSNGDGITNTERVMDNPPSPSSWVDIASEPSSSSSPERTLDTSIHGQDLVHQVKSSVPVKATDKIPPSRFQVKMFSSSGIKRKIDTVAKFEQHSKFLAKKRKDKEPTDDMQRARRDLGEARQALHNAQKSVAEALQYVREARKEVSRTEKVEKDAKDVLRKAMKVARDATQEARQARQELKQAENMQKLAWKEAREARKMIRATENVMEEAKAAESRAQKVSGARPVIDEDRCARCEGQHELDEEDSDWVSCNSCPRRFHILCTNMFHLPAEQIAEIQYSCPWCTYG